MHPEDKLMDMSQDRVSVNIQDLRERIEGVRDDLIWRELSLTQKIRILVQERLEQLERENSQKQADT